MTALELKKHRRIAAGGNDSARFRFGFQSKFLEVFRALQESDAIFAVENESCIAVRFKKHRGRRQSAQSGTRFATAVATAFSIDDWCAGDLGMNLPAGA